MEISCVAVFIVAEVAALPWFEALRALHPTSAFVSNVSLAALPTLLFQYGKLDLLLVQGPFHWFHYLTSTPTPLLWCSNTSPSKTVLPSHVVVSTMSHMACGGVLDGRWYVTSSGPTELGSSPPQITTRRIRHIINTATPGRFKACAPPSDDQLSFPSTWTTTPTSVVLDWNGLLPYSKPLQRIRCRSEFVATKWTQRGLSSKELCQAYDVPLAWTPMFHLVPPAQRHTLPFLSAPPTKLLKALWDRTTSMAGMAIPGGDSRAVSGHTSKAPRVIPSSTNINLKTSKPTNINDKSKTTKPTITNTNQYQPSDVAKPMPSPAPARAIDAEVGNFAKATKSDDAAVPVAIWDDRIWALALHDPARVDRFRADHPGRDPLMVLRDVVCARWKLNVTRSFFRFMRGKHGPAWAEAPAAKADCNAGRECIERMAAADFWSWKRGSRGFFWRWPEAIRDHIRDGFPLWTLTDPPRNLRPQRGEKDPEIKEKVREKVQKVRDLGYILPGLVWSLTNYFAVPKGENDIRMVYDATKSGLNLSLWAPSFALPTVDAMTRQMEESTWLADLDLGDMFLNFMLDAKLRAYCGIDLRPFFTEEVKNGETLWERWERCLMGLKSSPYVCIKAVLWAMETISGDRLDPANAYRWDVIVLNLPGTPSYDPQQPWLKKVRSDSGKIAGGTVTYVDDLRSLGQSKEDCWLVVHQTGAKLGYLGIQNAPRKTRPPSQTPGAWAGTVAEAGNDGIGVKCSREKWIKGKALIADLRQKLESSVELEHKPLEQMRGFFVHLQRTYPSMTPFIKGMHLTLDGWRPGRDSELWKVRASAGEEGYWDEAEGIWHPADAGLLKAPKAVKPAPRLKDDVFCLSEMMADEEPPTRFLRSRKISVAFYGFVDASGVGFGSAIKTKEGLSYRYGLWGRDADSTSSNYKELRNLVEVVEEGVQSGELLGTELFIFTDNSTAEGAFYKGNTDSRLLFDLVLRLRILDMKAALTLHVVHVAGTRMIMQGVDALSRGDLTEGVMAGNDMLQYIPLHLQAQERSSSVKQWMASWLPENSQAVWLTVEEWFERGHGRLGGAKNSEGVWIPRETSERWMVWTPPPAIADIALEELATSRHKRTFINHVFVCPRLMTQRWRKKLHKAADLVFEVPAGTRTWWPRSMHEPLIIGLTLRFSDCRPWQMKFCDRFLELGGQLRGLWKEQEGSELPVLRQLCLAPGNLETM